MNIAALLEHRAERRGSAPAIVGGDGRMLWSFDGLTEASARVARGLTELGIGRADRVLILEPDLRRLHPLVIGAIWAGAAAMVPPLALPARRALRLAAAERPSAVISSLPLWPLAVTIAGLRNAPIRLTSGRVRFPGTHSVHALSHHAPEGPASIADDDPALITFTTGSTGAAKPIVRTHGVLRAQHEALARLRPLDAGVVDLAGLPTLVLHDLATGVTSVPAPRGASSRSYGARVRTALVKTGAQSAAGFPHLFESALGGLERRELRQLRSIYVGGSRVRPELLLALKAAAPDSTITIVYGSTEVEPIASIGVEAYLAALAADARDGVCVGPVVDGLEVLVVREADRKVDAATLEPRGRILVRGPRAAGRTAPDGWVDTGDVGRVDGAGRIWLLGRAANVVGDVAPLEVERRVEGLAWVERAALVALSDTPARYLLAVQPRRWADAGARAAWQEALDRFVRAERWPVGSLRLVRHIPVTAGPAAKVDDARLRRLASAEGQRPGTR